MILIDCIDDILTNFIYCLTHLLIGDGSLFLIGQFHQRADICAQVGLTANEQDTCARTEVQDLSFPLCKQQDNQFSGSYTFTKTSDIQSNCWYWVMWQWGTKENYNCKVKPLPSSDCCPLCLGGWCQNTAKLHLSHCSTGASHYHSTENLRGQKKRELFMWIKDKTNFENTRRRLWLQVVPCAINDLNAAPFDHRNSKQNECSGEYCWFVKQKFQGNLSQPPFWNIVNQCFLHLQGEMVTHL